MNSSDYFLTEPFYLLLNKNFCKSILWNKNIINALKHIFYFNKEGIIDIIDIIDLFYKYSKKTHVDLINI